MSKKIRTISVNGDEYTAKSLGRVNIEGENFYAYEVTDPQGTVFTTHLTPGRDLVSHLSWVAAGQPSDIREFFKKGTM